MVKRCLARWVFRRNSLYLITVFHRKIRKKTQNALEMFFQGLERWGLEVQSRNSFKTQLPKHTKHLARRPTFLFHDFILVIHKEVTHAEKHCEDHWPSNCHRFLILLGQAATSATFCALGFQERLWLKKKVMKLSEDIRFFWFQRLNQHPEFGEMAWNVDNGCVKLPVLGKGMERWWKVLFFKDA